MVLDEICNDLQDSVVSPGVSSLVQCCFAATEDVWSCRLFVTIVGMKGTFSFHFH